MYRDKGLIIRSIPYSDSARIINVFTESKGLLALFLRQSSKRRMTGHLNTGSFIEFTAREKTGSSIHTLTDHRWNPQLPTDPLGGEESALWTFTLELLQKSLKENYAQPNLFHRLMVYYALLSQANISKDPLLPLVVVSSDLGISDLEMVVKLGGQETLEQLNKFGYALSDKFSSGQEVSKDELFNIECDRFLQHFGITKLESLYLIK